jgi:hypothetical protein
MIAFPRNVGDRDPEKPPFIELVRYLAASLDGGFFCRWDLRNAPYLTRNRPLAVPCSGITRALYSWIGFLFGADRDPAEIKRGLAAGYPASSRAINHLVDKFGSHAGDVLELGCSEPSLLEPLIERAPYIRAEVVYCAREEMVLSFDDLLLRRLGIELFDWQMALRAAPVAAELLANELGWNWSRIQEESRIYAARIDRFLREIGSGAAAGELV